jgi:methylase of polypeptide subunit release factors
MNIQQALQQASQNLSETSTTATLDAQVLLSCVLQCNTAHLAAWPEKELSKDLAGKKTQQRSGNTVSGSNTAKKSGCACRTSNTAT